MSFDEVIEPIFEFGQRFAKASPTPLRYFLTLLLLPLGIVTLVQTFLNMAVFGLFISGAVFGSFLSSPRLIALCFFGWNIFAFLFSMASLGWGEVLRDRVNEAFLFYLSLIPIFFLVWMVWPLFT